MLILLFSPLCRSICSELSFVFFSPFFDWANLHTNQSHLNLDVVPPADRRSTGIYYSAFAAEL
jgi:hypothetical protein